MTCKPRVTNIASFGLCYLVTNPGVVLLPALCPPLGLRQLGLGLHCDQGHGAGADLGVAHLEALCADGADGGAAALLLPAQLQPRPDRLLLALSPHRRQANLARQLHIIELAAWGWAGRWHSGTGVVRRLVVLVVLVVYEGCGVGPGRRAGVVWTVRAGYPAVDAGVGAGVGVVVGLGAGCAQQTDCEGAGEERHVGHPAGDSGPLAHQPAL